MKRHRLLTVLVAVACGACRIARAGDVAITIEGMVLNNVHAGEREKSVCIDALALSRTSPYSGKDLTSAAMLLMLRHTFIHLPGIGPHRERMLWNQGILELVTFNGSQFDVPFLRTHFPQARLDQAHIDLRFVFHTLGYRGGLKEVERNLGLHRDQAIQGVDGFEAVRLWHRWRRGDRAALRKLALYNLTDVVNLVELMDIAVAHKLRLGTFPASLPVDPIRTRTLDAEHVGNWVAEQLEAWKLD